VCSQARPDYPHWSFGKFVDLDIADSFGDLGPASISCTANAQLAITQITNLAALAPERPLTACFPDCNGWEEICYYTH